MGIVLESDVLETLLALMLVILTATYFYLTKDYNFWKDRNVPHIKASFPFGSTKDFFFSRNSMGEMYDKFYKEFKNEAYFGILDVGRPILVVRDPDLIQRILVKDFSHFYDRYLLFPANTKKDYLNNHLFNMTGKEWKTMRNKLSPTFTSGKMKAMFFLMEKCKEQLREYVEKETDKNPVLDVKDVLARFTMDIISTCAFGLETNSISERDSKIYEIGTEIFKPPGPYTLFKALVVLLFPFLTDYFFIPVFTSQSVTEFMTNLVKDTVAYREKNGVKRNDFLDLLIKIRQHESLNDADEVPTNENTEFEEKNQDDRSGITIKEMAAQVFVFFAAGFETASSTITFCLYELARHPDVQERLCQEIKQVLANHDGKLTYQALQDMTYMEQVINETLRLYASVPILLRACTKGYHIDLPDSNLFLKEGQLIVIPAYSIHHDPKYYPEPFTFDPERFSADQVKNRHPSLHLPFGEGPRMCIGNRFGMLQTKIGLAEMVLNFEFKLSPELKGVPLTINKKSFVTMPENKILLHVTKRK